MRAGETMQLTSTIVENLERANAQKEPFDYVFVPGLVPAERAGEILEDFPTVMQPGSFPLATLRYGAKFGELIAALTGPEFSAVVGEKLGLDLKDRPTLVTVRTRSRPKDGQIHADNPNKLVTLLLYMGGTGGASDGRLRLLRSDTDIDDFGAEIAPDLGNLLIFKNGPKAWHGFKSFDGDRRVVQINWVTDMNYVRREEARHSLSAMIKHAAARTFGRTPRHAS